jgi:hypothetical protein
MYRERVLRVLGKRHFKEARLYKEAFHIEGSEIHDYVEGSDTISGATISVCKSMYSRQEQPYFKDIEKNK